MTDRCLPKTHNKKKSTKQHKMSGGKLVAVDHVGGEQQEVVVREQVLSETHTIRVVFHDFANLPHDIYEETRSSALCCHGYQWQLILYPGGDDFTSEDEVFVSLYLKCISAKDDCQVKAKFAFRVPSANYSEISRDDWVVDETLLFSKQNPSRGCGHYDFLLRSEVLDPSKGFLVDGNLTIEVDIQVYMENFAAFRPKTTLDVDMMKLLESAKYSDVMFQVGSEKFSAHRNILDARAPELAAVAADCSPDTPIQIQGVKPSAFRSLLRFVYGNAVPESEELLNEASDLLDVANRFGCKGLKLLAEAELVESGITVGTAADLILIGDAKNCALLKEAAIDFFAKNAESVKSSPGWAKLRESAALLDELLDVVLVNKKRPAPADQSDEEKDYKRMCVSTLRRTLEDQGLDVDGSREILISRLEEVPNDARIGRTSNEDNKVDVSIV
jgi:speckle-type POZ protein